MHLFMHRWLSGVERGERGGGRVSRLLFTTGAAKCLLTSKCAECSPIVPVAHNTSPPLSQALPSCCLNNAAATSTQEIVSFFSTFILQHLDFFSFFFFFFAEKPYGAYTKCYRHRQMPMYCTAALLKHAQNTEEDFHPVVWFSMAYCWRATQLKLVKQKNHLWRQTWNEKLILWTFICWSIFCRLTFGNRFSKVNQR